MQLIERMDLIFKKRKLNLLLTPYEILSTGENCGIVEFIPDSFSIDYIKKKIQKIIRRKENRISESYRSKGKNKVRKRKKGGRTKTVQQ